MALNEWVTSCERGPPPCVGEVLGDTFPLGCSEEALKYSRLLRVMSDELETGGGLVSRVGELGPDCTGVVYSDELPEPGRSLLKSLMVDCMTLRAS